MDAQALAAEFSVNCQKRIIAAIFAVIIAHEHVLCANLDVAAVLIPVYENSPNRRGVGIVNRQAFESITAHELVPGFGRVGSLRVRIDNAG